MQLLKKSIVIDYMRKYDAYKLLYTKHIYNYKATTKTTSLFSNMEIYLLNHHIYNV